MVSFAIVSSLMYYINMLIYRI